MLIPLSLLLFTVLALYYKRRFGTIFNPISLYSIGFILPILSVWIGAAIGLLRSYTIEDAHQSILYYDIASLFFLLPWFTEKIKYKKQYVYPDHYWKQNRRVHLIILFLSLMLIGTFFLLGGIPIINMYLGRLSIQEHNEFLKRLPVGYLLLFGLLSYLYMLYIANFVANKKRYHLSLLKICGFVLFALILSTWQGKRQGVLFLAFVIICRVFVVAKKRNIGRKAFSYIMAVVAAIAFYVFFNNISSLRNNDMRNYDGTELLSYSLFPVMNFGNIIKAHPTYHYTTYPKYILYEITPNRISSQDQDIDKSYLFEPTSPSGYYAAWYQDFGLLGVLFGAFLLGLVSKYAYRYSSSSESNLSIYILAMWCCATTCIYSHLLTNRIILLIALLYISGHYIFRRQTSIDNKRS
jgi:oligosaccharide repeat unit polymerase